MPGHRKEQTDMAPQEQPNEPAACAILSAA